MLENKPSNSKDGLALIVGGLFVLGLVFATYTYFNKSGSLGNTVGSGTKSLKDIISSSTKRDEELEDKGEKSVAEGEKSNEEGKIGTESKGESNSNAGSVSGSTVRSSMSNSTSSMTYRWVANNYKKGDITGSTYTVRSGDTLWEIAEGVYGDGSQWTKILQANSGKVGRLPNGQQALIVPGQVLVLP